MAFLILPSPLHFQLNISACITKRNRKIHLGSDQARSKRADTVACHPGICSVATSSKNLFLAILYQPHHLSNPYLPLPLVYDCPITLFHPIQVFHYHLRSRGSHFGTHCPSLPLGCSFHDSRAITDCSPHLPMVSVGVLASGSGKIPLTVVVEKLCLLLAGVPCRRVEWQM